MVDQIIIVISIGEVDPSILEFISGRIAMAFKIKSCVLPRKEILARIPDPVYGGKYNSSGMLKYLSDKMSKNIYKLLAITELDLYSPIFSSFFGEAQWKGRCALVSLHRLRQEYYNLEPDRDLFLSRCEKEAIHEISHMLGLVHCCDINCVMYPSSNIIDTDSRSSSFCASCAEFVKACWD